LYTQKKELNLLIKMKVGIIGSGNIGSEVFRQCRLRGWEVGYIVDEYGIKKGEGDFENYKKIADINEFLIYCNDVDCAFMATPSDPEIEMFYVSQLISGGVPIVFACKGALSEHHDSFEKHDAKEIIGDGAAVGGGTGILPFLRERVDGNTKEIHLIVNGTINYCLAGNNFDESFVCRTL